VSVINAKDLISASLNALISYTRRQGIRPEAFIIIQFSLLATLDNTDEQLSSHKMDRNDRQCLIFIDMIQILASKKENQNGRIGWFSF